MPTTEKLETGSPNSKDRSWLLAYKSLVVLGTRLRPMKFECQSIARYCY